MNCHHEMTRSERIKKADDGSFLVVGKCLLCGATTYFPTGLRAGSLRQSEKDALGAWNDPRRKK